MLAACAATFAGGAEAACRLALVLALDVSVGVDPVAYRQQLRSVAAALQSPRVAGAVLAEPERPVALLVLEFAGPDLQRVVLPWSLLESEADLGLTAARLRAVRRAPTTEGPGLGAALLAAGDAFEQGPDCDRQLIDLSITGRSVFGPTTSRVLSGPRCLNVTVNALVVLPERSGADPEELALYVRNSVLHGPGAFLEVASGHSDYVRAITRKLLREIGGSTRAQ